MDTFIESGLRSDILKAIAELGFITPTPVQKETIPQLLLSDEDIIACAQTGTGKTAAFGLPILNQIDVEDNKVQAIILSPTRELCLQISKDIANYAKFIKGFSVAAVYGGSSIETQVQALKAGCQIVVGTPGRTLDLIKRKRLVLSNIRWVVLDEADEMLSMGFKDDLDEILSVTPSRKQTLLFSATMPPEILQIARKNMRNPVEISVGNRNESTRNVSHTYYVASAKDRYAALKRIVDIHPSIYGIIFCRTRIETKEVADNLMQDGYNADALHGDLSQAQRDYVMSRFRRKHLQLLVATDVAARGLDVNDLTHVLNYNLPDDADIYIHRSGRTGRAEKLGVSISIVHTREMNKIREIERKIGQKMLKKSIPSGKDICEKQLFQLVEKVEKIEVNDSQIEQYLPVIYKKLEWLDRELLIKHFVSVEFNRFLSYYENARDLNVSTEPRKEREYEQGGDSKRNRKTDKARWEGKDSGLTRFFINLGHKHRANPKLILGIINQYYKGDKINVGHIDIFDAYSFFDAPASLAHELPRAFKNANYKGLNVVVEHSKPSGKRRRND